MGSSQLTIIEFLLARIAEDEDYANVAPWAAPRVLAECQAKRVVIASEVASHVGTKREYADPLLFDAIAARVDTRTLRALAAVYADHPDYQQGWKL